ncbi:MAG: tRNA preQ1(34) S-adenosylmethionine ribosyltransferase-isomerase QueA [Bacillota bacterium]
MSQGPSLQEFDYDLPEELIAQEPLAQRDSSRLMVLCQDGHLEHRRFSDLPEYLGEGDCLVLNDTRVLPARLLGTREGTGGRVEMLLVEAVGASEWLVLAKPARGLKPGTGVAFPGGLRARVLKTGPAGERVVSFLGVSNVMEALRQVGQVPLPPYIRRGIKDPERYQTVYGCQEGSCAAPTAGLHFTPELLERVRRAGCGVEWVTLHVGPGTFQPVRTERVKDHVMHYERYWVPPGTARAVNESKRVVAVGTTPTRTLEASAQDGRVNAGEGRTDLFIYPGYRFRVIGALVTNFHLPRSTLLMLVAAFAGTERVMEAYREAVRLRYRFFSFGDAMLIL